MNAGKLDRRVTIQQPTETRDEFGSVTKVWTDLVSVWAHKREMSARERFAAGQELSERSAIWIIRWRTDITAKMRIRDDQGQLWDIQAVTEGFGRRESLALPCIRRTETDS